MFAIGIRYLCGWSMAAADGAAKEQPEWPPHPDRLYMALTAALYEGECEAEDEAALRWLEDQGAPSLNVSPANQRTVVTHFVPVNDTARAPEAKAGKVLSSQKVKDGLSLLPASRSRQPRQFPVALPHHPEQFFIWPDADPSAYTSQLRRITANVTCLGHSASLIQAWVSDSPPPVSLQPTDGIGTMRLRVPGPGRLDTLVARYNLDAVNRHADLKQRIASATPKEKKALKQQLIEQFPAGEPQSLRPDPARFQDYAEPRSTSRKDTFPSSLFDTNLLILRRNNGRPLGLHSTLQLTQTLHKTLLVRCSDPVPEWVSGHSPTRKASRHPHIALLPLADVGHQHADGHLLGVALALPHTIEPQQVRAALGWLSDFDPYGQPRPIRIWQRDLFDWQLTLETRDFPAKTLSNQTWTRASQLWASVTPLVFDRHTKGADRDQQASEMVATACQRIGLPAPASIMLTRVSPFIGTPHSREFPAMRRKRDQGAMTHSHIIIDFGQPIHGPVLLGAGRFRGYGVLRPLTPSTEG